MSSILDTAGGDQFAVGIAGQIASSLPAQITSAKLTGADDLDFGIVAVADTGDGTCKVMAADTDKLLGLVVRNVTNRESTSSDTIKNKQYDTVSILEDGIMFCKAAEAVRAHDQVLVLTAGGAGNTALGSLGGSQGGVAGAGRVDLAGAKWLDTTASGAIGRVRVKSSGTRRTTT